MSYILPPVTSREQLQCLKDVKESNDLNEPGIYERIDSFVHSLYNRILNIAEHTTDTNYIHTLNEQYDTFYSKYLDEILHNLRLRLPGCDVVKKVLLHDSDGNMYESSEMSLILPHKHLYIVFDWS